MSFPKARDIATRHASPRLASQAPKVRMIKEKYTSEQEYKIIISIRVKITPSKANKAINRWRRCITRVVNEANVVTGRIRAIKGVIA